tara:strand:+ start:486 stop:1337 length:852 start_codon:yes stop_codon:yes gene_type:complete
MDTFNLLSSFFNFIKRQWKFVLLFLSFGILLGVIYDSLKTPYYESTSTATSGLSFFEGIIDPSELDYPIIDQKIAIDMVNSLGEIVKNKEYEILSKKLSISIESAYTIKFIEAEQLYELDLENRRQKLSQFKILIRVTNNETIRELNQAFISYFNKNGYSNKNFVLFQKQSPELITYLEEEIIDLKSYRYDMKNKSEVELSTISIANDKSEILQNQIIQLYQKKQSLERDLELLKPFSFVSNFPVYKQTKSRTIFRISILAGLFFFLGLVIAFFRDLNNILNK